MKVRNLIFNVIICFMFIQTTAVKAHPHSWVSVLTEIEGDNKQISGLKMFWTFDLMTTSDALSGLDLSEDKQQQTLKILAKEMLGNIKQSQYFTHFSHYGVNLAFTEATQEKLILEDQKLTLEFRLILEKPLRLPVTNLALQVYEESYYVDFLWLAKDDIQLSESFLGDCSFNIEESNSVSEFSAYDPFLIKESDVNNELGALHTQSATIHCL